MDGTIGWWIALVLYVLGLPMMASMLAHAAPRWSGVVRLATSLVWPVVVAVLWCIAMWELITE